MKKQSYGSRDLNLRQRTYGIMSHLAFHRLQLSLIISLFLTDSLILRGLGPMTGDPRPVFPDAGPSFSHLRPSLFELLAQEQLRDLLHPVFRYILSVSSLSPRLTAKQLDLVYQHLTQRYPRHLLRVLNHHEEFFAALLLLLERHHLKKHS